MFTQYCSFAGLFHLSPDELKIGNIQCCLVAGSFNGDLDELKIAMR